MVIEGFRLQHRSRIVGKRHFARRRRGRLGFGLRFFGRSLDRDRSGWSRRGRRSGGRGRNLGWRGRLGGRSGRRRRGGGGRGRGERRRLDGGRGLFRRGGAIARRSLRRLVGHRLGRKRVLRKRRQRREADRGRREQGYGFCRAPHDAKLPSTLAVPLRTMRRPLPRFLRVCAQILPFCGLFAALSQVASIPFADMTEISFAAAFPSWPAPPIFPASGHRECAGRN